MSRISRSSLPKSGYFHIICRGNNHTILFRSQEDFLAYISRVKRFQKDWPFTIYHYCVMPTHAHFGVEVEDIKYLSKAFQGIQLSYYGYYNRLHKYDGHLWHGRFRSIPIEREDYLSRCARYIELNAPVAGLAKSPEEYRWSSYIYYALGKEDPLITPAQWYIELGTTETERQRAYKTFIYEGLESDWEEAAKLFE